MCFVPLILAGYLFTLHPAAGHPTSMNSPVAQAYTCEHGPGFNARWATEGVGSVGIHYGIGYTSGDWSIALLPQVGVGLLDHHVPELTSTVNFDLAATVAIGYNHSRIAVEYWHQSNAGLGDRNAGLDMVAIMGGLSF